MAKKAETAKRSIADEAPGSPGIPPTWSSSAKDMVATSLGSSRIWATVGYGILNEVYWPSTGEPQIRDFGFIILDEDGWHEIKRAQRYSISTHSAHVPLVGVVHEGEHYRLELEFLPHPQRDVLLIRYHLEGEGAKLYPLLAPHIDGERESSSATAGEDLAAEKEGIALALQSDSGFTRTSAGFVGVSDGWQDFAKNGCMTWTYQTATDGNVALTGELPAGHGVLALGFATNLSGARTLCRSALAEDYACIRQLFIDGWDSWGKSLDIPYATPELKREAELSAMVLKVHEDRTYGGAMIASLSIPWGNSHDDIGGYHLVWTRDAVEAALGLVTIGQIEDAMRVMAYLIGTQKADGSWAQNYFPDARNYWTGNQLDEVAMPLLLAAKLRAAGKLAATHPVEAMVRAAVRFIVQNGPVSDQDRWEENAGANPFTLAITIAAMVTSADYFDDEENAYLLSLADSWNERIENWTYASEGPLSGRCGVPGYYVRLAPRAGDGGLRGTVDVRNRVDGDMQADALVGMEFLYLVRTGLRRPDDPKILATLKVTDTLLKRETPSGVSYHRYNGDGYGEHEDGTPFDGTGIGRLWPLLTGERGHYAVLAGEDALPYLDAMARMTGPGGLIPEQIWDDAPIPDRGLYPGKPSGSAMPLVWAHAEFLKLLATRATQRPAELFDEVETRYGGLRPQASTWHWRKSSPFAEMPEKRTLSIEAREPFTVHLSFDNWESVEDRIAVHLGFGIFGVTVSQTELANEHCIGFTFYYPDREAWEGRNFTVSIGPSGPDGEKARRAPEPAISQA